MQCLTLFTHTIGKGREQKCNIPLVSIGIISVEGTPENNVHETHYSEECFTTQYELSTS